MWPTRCLSWNIFLDLGVSLDYTDGSLVVSRYTLENKVRLLKSRSAETKKVKIQIYVSPVDHKHLVEDSEKWGITISELVRSLIRKHYDNKLDRV